MKTLHLPIIVILLLSIISTIMPYASAHGVCTGLPPRFGRLDDTTFSKQSVQTGDIIFISGNITSLTQKNLTGWFTLHSIPGPYGRWEISNKSSTNLIEIPGNSRIPYSITIKPLQPGVYHLSPLLQVLGTNGGFSMLNGCNTEPVVIVTGNPICKQNFVAILKSEDNSPACVKYDTAQMLIERGWGHFPLRLG
jgi:methane/ammonia monooxygenase subunit B